MLAADQWEMPLCTACRTAARECPDPVSARLLEAAANCLSRAVREFALDDHSNAEHLTEVIELARGIYHMLSVQNGPPRGS